MIVIRSWLTVLTSIHRSEMGGVSVIKCISRVNDLSCTCVPGPCEIQSCALSDHTRCLVVPDPNPQLEIDWMYAQQKLVY